MILYLSRVQLKNLTRTLFRLIIKKIILIDNITFIFMQVSHESVFKILKNLDISKVAGVNNLSGKFIKEGPNVLAVLITQLSNLSSNCRLFLAPTKIAKLKALFKKSSKTDQENY